MFNVQCLHSLGNRTKTLAKDLFYLIFDIIFSNFTVNGNWAAWGQFGVCSVTCGSATGTQTRTRTCTDPAPANNGLDCSGLPSESQSCTTTVPCPSRFF